MKTIGIYSYPKSGNTWVKHVVAHGMGIHPAAIPGLHGQGKLSAAKAKHGLRFYKSHQKSYMRHNEGQSFRTDAVVHVRRNPLDVFLSYLNYISGNYHGSASIPFDSVDDIVGTDVFEMYLSTFITLGQVQNFAATGSYYEHNQLWLDRQKTDAVFCVRYEDLFEDAVGTLTPLEDFCGLPQGAIEKGVLKAAETTKLNNKFFWKQKVGNFKEYMSTAQIERFLEYRGDVCASLGYDRRFFLT